MVYRFGKKPGILTGAQVPPMFLSLLLAASLIPYSPPALEPAAVMTNVIARNHDLHSFEAAVSTEFHQRGFPFMHVALSGKAYFEAPDRYVVAFTRVPGYMHDFPAAYAMMLNVAQWPQRFTIAIEGVRVAGGHEDIALRLTPRDAQSGLVRGEALVDPGTWTIEQTSWDFEHDTHVAVTQEFTSLGTFLVLATQRFAVQVPFTKAAGTSTFQNYRLNVAIGDEVFAKKSPP